MALAVSIGGQVATRESDVRTGQSCPLSRGRVSPRFTHRVAPRAEAAGLAHRVALAVLGAVLNGCS
ncbi:MAG: hypothetical protein ACXWLR_08535 [Myxococcales bacterium]